MNDIIFHDLNAHVAEVIGTLPASLARRQQMQEELLAHLCDIYDEELVLLRDEWAAVDAAKQRFGPPDHLQSELAAAVPRLERLVLFISGKGNIMWRWLWIVGLLAVFVGIGFVLPAVARLRDPAPIMWEGRFGIGVLLPFGVVVTVLGVGIFAYSMVRVFRPRNC